MRGEGSKETHLSAPIVSLESHSTNCYLSVIFSLRIFFCLLPRSRVGCQRRACQERRLTGGRAACLSACEGGDIGTRLGSPRAVWLRAAGLSATSVASSSLSGRVDMDHRARERERPRRRWLQLRARRGSWAQAATVPVRTRVKQWLWGRRDATANQPSLCRTSREQRRHHKLEHL